MRREKEGDKKLTTQKTPHFLLFYYIYLLQVQKRSNVQREEDDTYFEGIVPAPISAPRMVLACWVSSAVMTCFLNSFFFRFAVAKPSEPRYGKWQTYPAGRVQYRRLALPF